MSPTCVVTRFGVLAHSLRCGFYETKTQISTILPFYSLLKEKRKNCAHYFTLKQWPKFIFEAVGGKLLETSGCIAMLILKH